MVRKVLHAMLAPAQCIWLQWEATCADILRRMHAHLESLQSESYKAIVTTLVLVDDLCMPYIALCYFFYPSDSIVRPHKHHRNY